MLELSAVSFTLSNEWWFYCLPDRNKKIPPPNSNSLVLHYQTEYNQYCVDCQNSVFQNLSHHKLSVVSFVSWANKSLDCSQINVMICCLSVLIPKLTKGIWSLINAFSSIKWNRVMVFYASVRIFFTDNKAVSSLMVKKIQVLRGNHQPLTSALTKLSHARVCPEWVSNLGTLSDL